MSSVCACVRACSGGCILRPACRRLLAMLQSYFPKTHTHTANRLRYAAAKPFGKNDNDSCWVDCMLIAASGLVVTKAEYGVGYGPGLQLWVAIVSCVHDTP